MVTYSIITFDETVLPSLYTLIPTLGTGLLIYLPFQKHHSQVIKPKIIRRNWSNILQCLFMAPTYIGIYQA